MKNKLIIAIISIATILGIILIIIYNRGNSNFSLENKEDGTIAITAENASKGSGGVGEITVQDGRNLKVSTDLEKNGSIKMEVIPSNIEYKTEIILEETLKGKESKEFQVPSGNYNIFFTAEKGTTGNVNISGK